MVILSYYIHYNGFTSRLPAMHVNLLCACWHSEAVKGSSSAFTRRLLISLCITSSLFLCPEPTDAPCSYYGDPTPPFPRWRPHPQGPHTLPYQGPRQNILLPICNLYIVFYSVDFRPFPAYCPTSNLWKPKCLPSNEKKLEKAESLTIFAWRGKRLDCQKVRFLSV